VQHEFTGKQPDIGARFRQMFDLFVSEVEKSGIARSSSRLNIHGILPLGAGG
jgi:hypothetical protein